MEISDIHRINKLGEARAPFLFIIDFEMEKPIILPLDEIDERILKFSINETHEKRKEDRIPDFIFEKYPYSFDTYLDEFEQVRNQLLKGNSFLVNLTTSTPLVTSLSLADIFRLSTAKYKLFLKDQFVCFSPETFIKIEGNDIATFPMKGTIDAAIPDAYNRLLTDVKEKAEHATIVDLLRNDLSRVAKKVRVEKFRYIESVQTHTKNLLQASSEIRGVLSYNYHSKLGDILSALIPAGSISGAPKPKTIEIIKSVEKEKRGYYTGVFGVYDGASLDSAVMIRYIEQTPKGLYYRSGGGIHAMSKAENEYQELIDKIYVPIYRKYSGRRKEDMESSLS